MITKVTGHAAVGVAKDPRRKSQSVQFKKRPTIPYKSGEELLEYRRQQKNALFTSMSIVAGSLLFTIGYFALAGAKRIK